MLRIPPAPLGRAARRPAAAAALLLLAAALPAAAAPTGAARAKGAAVAKRAAEADSAILVAASPILFATDLEKEEPTCWASRPSSGCLGWTGIRDACFNLCVGERARSGTKSLRVAYQANEDYGGAYRAVDGRHLFTRFYDYYDQGFDFAAGMKIHRLMSYDAARQRNAYDIILQLKSEEPNSNNCGLTDAKWLALSYNGGPVDWGSVEARFTPQRGRWYLVETEIKLNTPGASDGEVRVWLDGRIVLEKRAMNLTGTAAAPITSVLFGGWYSNSAAGRNPCPDPAGPSVRYIDDPAVSRSYIGPVPSAAPGPAPGTRVLSLALPRPGTLRAEYGPTEAYGSATEAATSASGAHTLVLRGLDTNRTYHYRLRGTFADGTPYVSPDLALSTRPEPPAQGPARPGRPRNLPAHRYDPIPD